MGRLEPVAWMLSHERGETLLHNKPLPRGAGELGWTETPLYAIDPEAIARKVIEACAATGFQRSCTGGTARDVFDAIRALATPEAIAGMLADD